MPGEQRSQNLGPLLMILCVLLISVALYINKEDKWGEVLEFVGIEKKADFFTLAFKSDVGRVVEGFPIEFLGIVSDMKVLESARYSGFGPEEGRERLLVRYETAVKASDMFVLYINLLNEGGYEIESAGASGGTNSIFASGKAGEVEFEISTKNLRTSEIVISVRRAVVE